MSNKETADPVTQGANKAQQNSELSDLLDAAAEATRSGDYWKAKSDPFDAMGIVDQQVLDMEHAVQKQADA